MTQVPNPDFQNYLQSVCDRYQHWQRFYTPTDAQGKKQLELDKRGFASPFDFGQTVKSISSKQSEEEEKQKQKQEEIEQLLVLEGITKYAPNHVLLTGKPGSGKSTALARLLLQEAEKTSCNLSSSSKAEVKIPVLVELRYYSTSVLDLIEDWFKSHQLLLNASEIKTLLFQKRFLLLIDGLNEVPSSEAMRKSQRFRLTYQATPMIFTTRQLDSGGNLRIEKLLEMQPLTEAQSQKFVSAYLAEKGEQLLKQLGKRLREFGQTPLLLWMLCELFKQREEIPSNLGLIFRQFTQGYEKHLKEDVPVETDRRQWQYLLQHLAFMMMQGKKPTDFRVAIPKQQAKQILRQFWQGKVADPKSLAIKYLDDLLKYHLIQNLIQIGSSEQIEFRHPLLQEYYAAEYLLQKLDDLSHEEIKRDYLNYLKWTEPIALMLALVDQEEQAVQIVQLALEVDLNLAARLAGEVKPEFQEKTVGLIQQLEVPTLLKIQFLELTNSERAVRSLIEALKDQNSDVRKRAVAALGNIGSDRAVPSLIPALKDEDSDVRKRAVAALGNIGSDRAVPSLIPALKDEDSDVCRRAVEVLGQIGSESAVAILSQALNHEDSEVRREAASALGKIGSETVVPILIQALNDEDSGVHWNAREALSRIGSEKVVSSLIQNLNDEDYQVRCNAVAALGRIGSETAVPNLIQALNDEDYRVRQEAISALGQIGSETAVPSLIRALNDEDYYFRRSAAFALGQIGSETAVPSLIRALNDEDYYFRGSAAFALELIGSEKVITSLIQVLKDEDSEVRNKAVSVLGRIGSEIAVPTLMRALNHADFEDRWNILEALGRIGSEIAVPTLMRALNHGDFEDRWNIFEALGRIGSEAPVPSLIQALNDEDYWVRYNALHILGQIGSETAIPGLSQALKYGDDLFRRNAATFLGQIGSETAVSSLIQALKDDNSDVRWNVVEALGQIGSETAVTSLIQALNDKDFDVRRNAISALGQIGSETAVLTLIQALNDEDYVVRANAAYALGKIGSETAVSSLIEALNDKDFDVHWNVVEALGNIGSAKILDHLWELQLEANKTYLSDAIKKIQARCQFYNYEVFNSISLSSEKDTQNILIMPENSSSSKYSFPQAKYVNIVETNSGVVASEYTAAQKQNLVEAAKKIQQLLEQLAQTNPTIVESPREETVLVNIEREIKNNPTIKARLLSALKAGGTEALTLALEVVFKNPLVSIPVETIKGFIEA